MMLRVREAGRRFIGSKINAYWFLLTSPDALGGQVA